MIKPPHSGAKNIFKSSTCTLHPALPVPTMSSDGAPNGTGSGPARKRPRLLEEAVEAGDGVAVKFADSFAVDNQSLVLLQVPESLLDEMGEDADLGQVKLIGSEGQDAVLVTSGQTFKLTKAETSNTLLLLPPEGTCGGGSGGGDGGSDGVAGAGGEGGFEVVAAVDFQYEISKATPSLEQIRSILEACSYRGKEHEASIDRERLAVCALEELQTRVQFSHRELLEGLQKLEALSIEGCWRMIEPSLMESTADQLLSAIVEHDMPLERVDAERCVAALPHCEPLVLKHCLRTYSLAAGSGQAPAAGGGDIEGGGPSKDADATTGHYRLDLDKVARLRAHQILRAHEAEAEAEGDGPLSLTLADFEERWAAAMPGVDTPSQDLLKGIALVEKKTGTDGKTGAATVSYVPASGLPFAPAERLAALFRIKAKWPMGELEPYISEADRKAGFLLKNTRFSTDPATGLKLFSAR